MKKTKVKQLAMVSLCSMALGGIALQTNYVASAKTPTAHATKKAVKKYKINVYARSGKKNLKLIKTAKLKKGQTFKFTNKTVIKGYHKTGKQSVKVKVKSNNQNIYLTYAKNATSYHTVKVTYVGGSHTLGTKKVKVAHGNKVSIPTPLYHGYHATSKTPSNVAYSNVTGAKNRTVRLEPNDLVCTVRYNVVGDYNGFKGVSSSRLANEDFVTVKFNEKFTVKAKAFGGYTQKQNSFTKTFKQNGSVDFNYTENRNDIVQINSFTQSYYPDGTSMFTVAERSNLRYYLTLNQTEQFAKYPSISKNCKYANNAYVHLGSNGAAVSYVTPARFTYTGLWTGGRGNSATLADKENINYSFSVKCADDYSFPTFNKETDKYKPTTIFGIGGVGTKMIVH
jgi:hypothetical protein